MPKLNCRRTLLVNERTVKHFNPKTGKLKTVKVPAVSDVQPVKEGFVMHFNPVTRRFKKVKLSADSNVQPVLCPDPDVCVANNIQDNCGIREAEEKSYWKSRQHRQTCWDKIHDQLINVYTELYAPSFVCKLCPTAEEVQPEALIRCLDCGSHAVFCAEHYATYHQSCAPFHCPDIWNGHYFVPYTPALPTLVREDHIQSNCSKSTRVVTVIGMQGRLQTFSFQFCSCEGEAVTLLRHRLWAASPDTPKVAFQLDLMTWLRALVLECQVPVKGFVEALASKMDKVHSLYRSLITDSFNMFMRHHYEISHLQHINKDLDNGTECPACDSNQIISFDANFGLARKKSSGRSVGEPFHKGLFFIDQTEVDNFLATHKSCTKKGEGECSNFQAGSNIRSKSRTIKMDETAVFGCACRHEFPRLFFNLKHGERLGYAVFLLKKLMEGKNELTVMYDIACVLEAHLKKNSSIDISRLKLVLPIFHSYGHKMSCQLIYGPRKAKGVGLTDGETMERLWSYLRKFSTITKQMTAQRRVDLLTDALLHYASKLRKKLGKHINHKLKKVEITEKDSKQQLQKLIKEQKEPVNLATVERWQSEEKTACQVADGSLTTRDKYLLALYELYSKQSSVLELNQEEEITNPEVLRLAEKVQRFQNNGQEVMVSGSEEYRQALSCAVDSHRRTHINKLRAVAAERSSSLMQLHAARGQAVAKKIGKTVLTYHTLATYLVAHKVTRHVEGPPVLRRQRILWCPCADRSCSCRVREPSAQCENDDWLVTMLKVYSRL